MQAHPSLKIRDVVNRALCASAGRCDDPPHARLDERSCGLWRHVRSSVDLVRRMRVAIRVTRGRFYRPALSACAREPVAATGTFIGQEFDTCQLEIGSARGCVSPEWILSLETGVSTAERWVSVEVASGRHRLVLLIDSVDDYVGSV